MNFEPFWGSRGPWCSRDQVGPGTFCSSSKSWLEMKKVSKHTLTLLCFCEDVLHCMRCPEESSRGGTRGPLRCQAGRKKSKTFRTKNIRLMLPVPTWHYINIKHVLEMPYFRFFGHTLIFLTHSRYYLALPQFLTHLDISCFWLDIFLTLPWYILRPTLILSPKAARRGSPHIGATLRAHK